VLAAAGLLLGATKSTGAYEVLFHFGEEAGEYPDTDLVIDPAGNLYGMTVLGGKFGSGTVFQLSPSAAGWVETVLHHFPSGVGGAQPYGGVTLDAQGNLYGTTVVGGTGLACEEGCGTVFKLTKSGTTWTHSILHSFQGGEDGSGPGGPVALDHLGNVYGTTPTGGAYGMGTVYELTPLANGQWQETIIHHFTGGEDGGTGSKGRLLIDRNRNIFGVTTIGGTHGLGVVFRMTPGPAGWSLKTLYSFTGKPGGSFPYGGLIRDDAGTFYGTTYYGGSEGDGVVYKLSQANGVWSETVLHHFVDGEDGAYPIGGLVWGNNGRLYGTTSDGGSSCGCGTVFELRRTDTGDWKERIVHAFTGPPDGRGPYMGLAVDAAGTLYGATVYGGLDDDGTVFAFRP
jgi:uncharacterized repeat protein (TIGR03803 family)